MILVKNITIVTQNPRRQIIKNGGLVIEKDRIKTIGQSQKIEKEYRKQAKKVIDGQGKVVLPGLINTHGHLAMALLRGYADDLPLEDWWFKYVYPAESRFTAQHVYWGSLLSMLEMIKSGTTCFTDFYYYQDEVAKAARKIGMRGVLGCGILDVPTFYFKNTAEALKRAQTIIEEWTAYDLIKVSLAPHMFQTTSLDTYQQCKNLAERHNLLLQTHTAETKGEVSYCLKKYKKRPVELLAKAGILDQKTLLAHACWLTKGEIKILAQAGASVAHCPVSNMKLASGIIPLPAMLKAGINVGLGTDSPCSNNNLDMFEEMKTAALLHKIDQLEPTLADAQTVLDMATINGAKALGLTEKIGSLEKGKKADLIILNFRQPHLMPCRNVVSHLVYAASGGDVETVIIDGQLVMEKRRIKKINQDRLLDKIEKLAIFKKK
jgi:5-methylthioadenosine/S-adenosylhomocysteine deaminase